MNNWLLLAMIDPPTIIAIVIFVGVTAATFAVIGRINGGDKPRAEARLDMMRKRRGEATEEKEKNKKVQEDDGSGRRMILLAVFGLLVGVFLIDFVNNFSWA